MFKYAVSIVMMLMPLLTLGETFVAGKDYQEITSSERPANTGKPVHVIEFFSYGCPWCYRLDSAVSQWVKTREKDIYFSTIPVVFNKDWEYYARACYIIQALSLGKPVHDALFKAIILDKQPLTNQQAMVDFFSKHGVDPTLVESALARSPSMEIQLATDAALMAKYQINAVPTLLVNEQYKTNLQMAKSEKRLFEILDYLVSKVKQERTKQQEVKQ
jgi:protein dithiol oxidoreductase (disulfide-forming)